MLEPALGFEPRTYGLQNRCSTAELSWLKTIENKAFYAVIFAGFLGACILNLYMVCFFSYEDNITITNQAQNGRGLGQNTVSQPHPLQTQRDIFWARPGQWQVNSPLAGHARLDRCQAQALRLSPRSPSAGRQQRAIRQWGGHH